MEQNEAVEYDLDVIELNEFYQKVCRLFDEKNKLVKEFYDSYTYEESVYLDYLMTRKIEDILK
ncbi:hypothetical protein [uncultured Mailhella sp.]|uniref:hypothetical protein n=1 Tax=uncultured Mailhella sp. TaxID=1981031 RepID=UPI0025CE131A|nr:hypothetical protein [uncultured Mailhella sp.]